MTAPKISAAVKRALAECETVEEIAQVFDAVKAAGLRAFRPDAPEDPASRAKVRAWFGLDNGALGLFDFSVTPAAKLKEELFDVTFESPPCGFISTPVDERRVKFEPSPHFETLARRGGNTDTRSMIFGLLKLARQERSRIEKIPFHPRRVKDDIKRRHAEILKEARAFRSFPDYRRLP